jgi:hypothetical protein
MKEIMLGIGFFCCLVSVQAQEKQPLQIGEIRRLQSTQLGEERILNICLPQAYDTAKTYPVLYLLDGSMNEDFLHIMGLVQFFNMQFSMPQFIIVGIANVDRKRDFTFPTKVAELKKEFPTTGQSAKFISFISLELQPFIEKNYKTNGVKYLIGQSLGGLLATEILLKNAGLFTHYLMVSPSLWWDDASLLNSAEAKFEKQKAAGIYVYIAVGKDETAMMKKQGKQLYEIIKAAKKKDLKIDFLLMPNENHATILHNSIYAAFLKLYPFKANQ